jgi:hypothetical protein
MKFVICLMLTALTAFATNETRAQETSHLAFVTEYIRELSANEAKRAAAQREVASAATQSEMFIDMIHSSTAIQLELRSQIYMLQSMHLEPPSETIVPTIIGLDQYKIGLHQKLIEIASAVLEGPKPGIDFNKMATTMPQIRALLDNIEETLMQISPLVFVTLIDQRPDSQNHVNHLVITKSERDELTSDIKLSFGTKLQQKDQNYTVGAASVLLSFLSRDYKCADDPWQ